MTRTCLFALAAATVLAAAEPTVGAQTAARPASPDRSATRLRRSLDGLTTTARVLIVGMHPDDELPELSTWLSLGRHVETAYLFVTRGEAGEDFTGPESGPSLGVVRVGEALNARRIDGAHLYFTAAFDFGPVRTADEVFLKQVDTTIVGHWDRDTLVADVVTVIRAFRPQVIVAVQGDTVAAGNGQHAALLGLLDAAFGAADDSLRFKAKQFGAPWPVAKLYRVGRGITIHTSELDRPTGRSYTSIAADVRSQQRSQGPSIIGHAVTDSVSLELIASRVNRDRADTSLFDGVDTSVARLEADASPELAQTVQRLASLSDSLRPLVDVMHPSAAISPLSEIAKLAASLRSLVQSCSHASMVAAISVVAAYQGRVCDAVQLDRDAAADLIRDRANDALLAAAGIEISASSDRELLASLDTATVTITIANRGAASFRLGSLSVHRAIFDPLSLDTMTIAAGTTVHLRRRIERLQSLDAWWLGNRENDRYPPTLWTRDGLRRPGVPESSLAPAEAIPDEIRRVTDVSLLLEIGGATITTSIGPVLYRYVDPIVGLQNRQISGVPEVTLRFARNLEWFPISKPVDRVIRVKVQSYSDHPVVLGLGKAAESGIIVDAIPKEVTLEPHEQHELLLPLRGTIAKQAREQFLLWGLTPQITTYQMGFQPVTRDYLEPARIPRATGVYLQGVNVVVPPGLTLFYVPEGVDDIRSVLTEIGITAREIDPEVLLTADLTHITTIVLASHAVERFPEIAGQANRLMDFVRKGGTLVIQRGSDTTIASKLLPFPVSFATPAEAVLHAGAAVTVVDSRSRLLSWPNVITNKDWETWIAGRAESVPTTADARYQRVIETHDPGQPANTNAILVAHVGKGTLIYTSLTFDQQIAGASTGALRLFVNLISAGITR